MNCGQAGLFCGNRSILSVSKDDANRAMIRKGRKAVMLLFTRRTERRLLLMTISYKVKGTTDWHGDAAKFALLAMMMVSNGSKISRCQIESRHVSV
jgi:hypothetical protein